MYHDVNEWFTSFLFETFSSKQSKCERCLKYWINARFANVEFRSPFQFYLVLKSQATRAIKIATIVFHTLKNLFVAQFVIYSITSNFCNQVILKVIAIVIDLVRAFSYPALDAVRAFSILAVLVTFAGLVTQLLFTVGKNTGVIAGIAYVVAGKGMTSIYISYLLIQ